jgi:hypothetical protein
MWRHNTQMTEKEKKSGSVTKMESQSGFLRQKNVLSATKYFKHYDKLSEVASTFQFIS